MPGYNPPLCVMRLKRGTQVIFSATPSVLYCGGCAQALRKKFPTLRWIDLDISAPPPTDQRDVLSDSLGCVCIDTEPQQFYTWWSAHIGGPPPGVYQGDMAGLGDWLMQGIIADRAGMAGQFGALSRQIGQLRQTCRDQREEIAYLRQQMDGRPRRTLFDIAGQGTVELACGAQLHQRLPGEVAGLGGLIVALKQSGRGRLVIRLIVTEDQVDVARWQIDDPDGSALRLSLPGPLRMPRRSAQLVVQWQGEGPLYFAAAPVDDPVYGAQIDGTAQPLCLAMRAKNHGFAHGVAPHAPLQPRVLAPDVLAQAQSNHRDRVTWLDMEQALMVHPAPKGVSAAYLPGLVPPGTAQIRVELETLHIRSGPICYAIGIAPGDAPVSADGGVQFAPDFQSQWRTVGARDRQVLVFNPPVADRPFDLWLMTRLPEGRKNTSWGWATFSGLSLWT